MDKKKEYNIAVYLCDAHVKNVGIGEFEDHLARELYLRASELKDKYHVHLHFIVPENRVGAYGGNVEYIAMNKRVKRILNWRILRSWRKKVFPQVDLVHWTHQTPAIRRPLSPCTLITVHDVNFFHNNLSKSRTARKARRIKRRLACATHLSFISHFTESDVREHFNISVPARVIYNGVTDLSRNAGKCAETAFPTPYLFHISRLAAKKNVHLLVEMMRYLPGMHLIVAGKGRQAYEDSLHKIIDEYALKNVIFTGKITEEEKTALYRDCRAFMFPSLSEGFGLPVVEAMCFGKPVFISDKTSLPEVGGKEAFYLKQLEPKAMAEAVKEGLKIFDDDKVRNAEAIKKHAASFSWKQAADAYIDYYLNILGIEKA